MNWYIGTMGFSYIDWKGVFYPHEMPSRNYLAYYSRVFNCVEIDSTFYGTPRIETIKRWWAVTPEHFKFCVKVPRIISHELGSGNKSGLMEEFLDSVRLLKTKLGVILIQFPPSFKFNQLNVLDNFISGLPAGFHFSVEVRDRSWYTNWDEFSQLLSTYGVCWAATEYPRLPNEIHLTAPFAYVRWVGKHGSYSRHDHERVDRLDNLGYWSTQIDHLPVGVCDLYGFFNNDYAGFAPGTANRFKTLVGLSVENYQPPEQGTLF